MQALPCGGAGSNDLGLGGVAESAPICNLNSQDKRHHGKRQRLRSAPATSETARSLPATRADTRCQTAARETLDRIAAFAARPTAICSTAHELN